MLRVSYLRQNTTALETTSVLDWDENVGFIKQIPNLYNNNSKRICHYTFLAGAEKYKYPFLCHFNVVCRYIFLS